MRLLALRSPLFAAAVLVVCLFLSILSLPTVATGENRLPPCRNDLPTSSWDNCQGTLTYADGTKFVGQFKDGKQNGQGTFTFGKGRKYVGEYKDGKQNGQGTLTYADGTEFVG